MANSTWRNGDIEEGPPPQRNAGDTRDSDTGSTEDTHTGTTKADK